MVCTIAAPSIWILYSKWQVCPLVTAAATIRQDASYRLSSIVSTVSSSISELAYQKAPWLKIGLFIAHGVKFRVLTQVLTVWCQHICPMWYRSLPGFLCSGLAGVLIQRPWGLHPFHSSLCSPSYPQPLHLVPSLRQSLISFLSVVPSLEQVFSTSFSPSLY